MLISAVFARCNDPMETLKSFFLLVCRKSLQMLVTISFFISTERENFEKVEVLK